ncbi:hypothetical protein Y032_0007g3500 [Ancylostoma ceylanicum]|uniref:Uncharacterized protein n=1 Tax=Ancylostoma ceylanicum TaxID=53326 RepID=A0A016VPF6_9BILA|nr:hypothetical protein Y032_0007g3500 [Ancylostoma ceylanicum]
MECSDPHLRPCNWSIWLISKVLKEDHSLVDTVPEYLPPPRLYCLEKCGVYSFPWVSLFFRASNHGGPMRAFLTNRRDGLRFVVFKRTDMDILSLIIRNRRRKCALFCVIKSTLLQVTIVFLK